MRQGWPSLTAAIVAIGRGVGMSDETRDTMAAQLLPPVVGDALSRIGGRGMAGFLSRSAARVASLGLVDHVTLRMAAIDEVVEGAVAEGCEQLVILGAGLDTRAYRMDALNRAAVFEVDHPATQAYKRARVAQRAPVSRSHRFVAVDFEVDEVVAALEVAGHEASSPTVWVWEGVTMYLRRDAIRGTLADVASRSASGSVLAVSYASPDYLPLGVGNVAVDAAFQILGEPLHGVMHGEELEALLEGEGFRVTSDSDSEQWAQTAGHRSLLPGAFRKERLMVASRTPLP